MRFLRRERIDRRRAVVLGWFALISDQLPPVSLILSYWMVGAFFMAIKRFAEYRRIGDQQRAAAYRRSFRHYTEERLLVSIFFYVSTCALFAGVFIVRYHLELILLVPLFGGFFAYYMKLGLQEDSPVQNPEKLYRQPGFLYYSVLCVVMFVLVMYFAVAILILNAMLMAVFERIREFGVLKALGVGPLEVMRLIATESAIQSVLAVIVGLAIATPSVIWLAESGFNIASLAGVSVMGIAMNPIWRAVIEPEIFVTPVLTLFGIVALGIEDQHLIAAEGSEFVGLFFATDDVQSSETVLLSEPDDHLADGRTGCRLQQPISWRNSQFAARQDVGGGGIHQEHGRLLDGDIRGQRYSLRCWDQCALAPLTRVGARNSDTLSLQELPPQAAAARFDDSDGFVAGRRRQRRQIAVNSPHGHQVGRIHRAGKYADAEMAGSGSRGRYVFERQHLCRLSEFFENHGSHVLHPFESGGGVTSLPARASDGSGTLCSSQPRPMQLKGRASDVFRQSSGRSCRGTPISTMFRPHFSPTSQFIPYHKHRTRPECRSRSADTARKLRPIETRRALSVDDWRSACWSSERNTPCLAWNRLEKPGSAPCFGDYWARRWRA